MLVPVLFSLASDSDYCSTIETSISGTETRRPAVAGQDQLSGK
jgi:hypothetical protein